MGPLSWKFDVKSKIVFLIIVLIGFQQFPIISIGGSLKIYEILAIFLLFTLLTVPLSNYRVNYITLLVFGFFVASPIISYLYSRLVLDYPSGFYARFADTDSFKFNYYIFPLLQMVYMFFNFAVFITIYYSTNLYLNFEKLVRSTILIATIISVYSLISMFTVDIVRLLPSFIQAKHDYVFRSYGLSQEPSFYVLYQGWICLFIYYSKKIYANITWKIIFAINVVSFIFCFSTMLIGFLISVSLIALLSNSVKNKIKFVVIILCFFTLIFWLINAYELSDWVDYYFLNKINNFYTNPDHTLDSGSFRRYTSALGLKIFSDHILTGVGVGSSIYYMYIYEFKMGISIFGETLTQETFPQNSFSLILCEQGLLGSIPFFLILINILKTAWANRKLAGYSKMFLIGSLFNIIAMFSIAPVYSLFLWVFMALGLGYNRFQHKMMILNKVEESF